MSGCSVTSCTNTQKNALKRGKLDLSFHRFPSQPWLKERRKIWIRFVKRPKNVDGTPWIPSKRSAICSEHFVGGEKSEDPRHPAYNPTILDPTVTPKENSKVAIGRYKRMAVRVRTQRDQLRPSQKVQKIAYDPEPKKDAPGLEDCSKNAPTLNDIEFNDMVDKEPMLPSDRLQPLKRPGEHLCLICCEYTSHNFRHVFHNNFNFTRFCKLLCQSTENKFKESFLSFDDLSICSSCLSTVDSVVTKNAAANQVLESVKRLQLSLMKEMKLLQLKLHRFQNEMKKIQESVRTSSEQRLLEFVKEKMQSSSAVYGFRYKIIQKVELLEEIGRSLQEKVDCTVRDQKSPSLSRDQDTVPNCSETSPNDNYDGCISPEIHPKAKSVCDSSVPSEGSKVIVVPVSSLKSRPKPVYKVLKRTLKFPVVVGKTVRNGLNPNSKVVVKHIWDGVRMRSITSSEPEFMDAVEPSDVLTPDDDDMHHQFEKPSKPPKIVTCPACKKSLVRSYLVSHRKYSCPVTATDLPKDHLCHLCSMAFKSMKLLCSHIQSVHVAERTILCSQCPKAFKSMYELRQHEKTHLDIRAFVCGKGCGGGFKHDKNRNRHEKFCDGRGTPVRKKAKIVVPPKSSASVADDAVEVISLP